MHASIASGAGQLPDAKIDRKSALEFLLSLVSHTLNSFCSSAQAPTPNPLQIIQFFFALYIDCTALFIPKCVRYMCSAPLQVESIQPMTGPVVPMETGTC